VFNLSQFLHGEQGALLCAARIVQDAPRIESKFYAATQVMDEGGWFYLSTILDDFSRFIVARKLCTTMRAADVTETIGMALVVSGLDGCRHRPLSLERSSKPSTISTPSGESAWWTQPGGREK